jgi:hypothetical protein
MKTRFEFVAMVAAATLSCTSNGTEARQGPTAARVAINGPNPLILNISTSNPYRVTADVYDAAGAVLDGSVRIVWSSTDTTVAQIDSSGTLFMRRLGSSFVRASVSTEGARLQDSVKLDVIAGGVLQKIPLGARP